MRVPIRVVVRDGPKKGRAWDGLLMSELEVGTCPIITNNDMSSSHYSKLSEIRELSYDTSLNCIYMDTAGGNKYILYIKAGQ